MLRIVWAEFGMLPRRLRAAAFQTGHNVIKTLEFPGQSLRPQDSRKIKEWIPQTDVLVICNTPSQVPLEFASIKRCVERNNKVLVRIENTSTPDRQSYHVVDRPGFYSSNHFCPMGREIEDRLLFTLDSYEAKRQGITLPPERKLILFESNAIITPLDIASLISNPRELQHVSPRAFEELIADLLTVDGWTVELIARNNASGPDIIAFTEKFSAGVPIKMIVECKRHRDGRPVDIDVVRKVMYWVNEEFRSTFGLIATTSRFTSVATQEAKERHRWRLDLRDQSSVVSWIEKAFVAQTVT